MSKQNGVPRIFTLDQQPMRVFVRGKSKMLWIYFRLGGRTFRESSRTTDREKARQFLACRYNEEMRRQAVLESPERMPLSLAFEGFEKQLGGSEATGWDRKKIVAVRSFVGWLGKFKPLEAVTITRLSAYVDFRMESVVPQTVHRDLSALSTFFQWTVRKGWIVRNPVRDVQRPKAIPQKRFGLPAEEVRRVLVAVEGTILEPVFKLAFFQGLRRSEIVAAHFEDVNLELGTFYVRGGKTPESAATLPLHPEMARYVSANGLEVASNGQFIGPIVRKRRIRAGEAACYSPCSLENYRKEMNAAGARLPNFHLARHTLGTLLVEKGVDIYRVSRLLRHSSVRTTERYYVHLRPAIAREDLAQFLA